MAVDLINVGQIANDGTGDDLREAFIKVNQNFEELDLKIEGDVTASNTGAVGEGIFSQKINNDLQFKKLVAGSDITLTATNDQITIDANGGLKSLLVTTDTNSVILTNTAGLNIVGGEGIETGLSSNTLTITNTGAVSLSNDPNPVLNENLNANDYDIQNANAITATRVSADEFIGDLEGLVYGLDIRDTAKYLNDYFDLGEISPTYDNILDWIISESVVDLGTFTDPNPKNLDFGSF